MEQTSSGVLPIAALRTIIRKGLIPDITTEETDKFMKPGIERLFSLQTEDGGFGYWPGDRSSHKWGSIYALTAISRAGNAGFDLPRERMRKAMAYLQDQIKASGRDEYSFRAYAAYILAQNGALGRETFNKVFEHIDSQPNEAVTLVLMAAKLGRHLPDEQIKGRLRGVITRPWSAGRYQDEFHAVYREPAVMLMAASLILPDEDVTHKLGAKLLSGMNPSGIWTSTSDSGWSLAALSEYFGSERTDQRAASISVRQAGRPDQTFTLAAGGFYTLAIDPKEFLRNPSLSITSSSDATTLYKLSLTFPRTDYARNGYANGFEVQKTIRNTDGSNTIRVGDIVEVKVKINIKQQAANYVVLDDPLPAGFVAINSAIKTEEAGVAQRRFQRMAADASGDDGGDAEDGEFGEGFGWNDWYWDPQGHYRFTPNFMEMRNDRVLAFRNRAWGGIYEYSYYARAVCEGEFVMPSTKVQLMYDPDVVAYTPMGRVVIKGN